MNGQLQVRPTSRGVLTGIALALVLTTGAGSLALTMAKECVPNERDGSCLPIAAANQRVDLTEPSFSNPTTITNPLFPIGDLDSVLMLGEVDGKPFRTEVTLLPDVKTITWNGQAIDTLVSQYVAYLDGRLHEVALDWYAQADDGAVWYLGEDVFNYDNGVVADTHGTWIAGKDGPAGMIMPANPQVGDVYRPENIPGLVFEEVTIAAVAQGVDGPAGPITGAIVVSELHQDGGTEEKTFAPGYGEFSTGGGGDIEAAELAVPTDALTGLPSADLEALLAGAEALSHASGPDWSATAAVVDTMVTAWNAYRDSEPPAMIAARVDDALATLVNAAEQRDPTETVQAAIDIAQSALDLELRQRPAVEIDRARFALWGNQLAVDAAAGKTGAVMGDVATLEWIWARFAHTVTPAAADEVEVGLTALRAAAGAGDLDTAVATGAMLHRLLLDTESVA